MGYEYLIAGFEDIALSERVQTSEEQLLELLDNPAEDDLILTVLWEAMGWYDLSYRADEIAAAALKASTDERFSERVRNEALKTYNRVTK